MKVSSNDIKRMHHEYMAKFERNAPPGIMELFHAVQARGPIFRAEGSRNQNESQEDAKKAELDREVARICAEIDSGEYQASVAAEKKRFREWREKCREATRLSQR